MFEKSIVWEKPSPSCPAQESEIEHEKNFEARILCPDKQFFKCSGVINMFSDFQNLRRFSTQRCKLKTLLEKIPKYEEKSKRYYKRFGGKKEILWNLLMTLKE